MIGRKKKNENLIGDFATKLSGKPYLPSEIDMKSIHRYSLIEWMNNVSLNPELIHGCEIKISEISHVPQKLFQLLKSNYGINSPETTKLFNIYLGAACPQCGGGIMGNIIQTLGTFKSTNVVLFTPDASIESLINGKCPHCSSRQYILIWLGDKGRQ